MNKLFQQKQSLALYNFKGVYNERIIRDCRECRLYLSVWRFGRCGNRRGIVYRLWRCQRLVPAVRSCLCRCTPAIGGYHPRRSGCVSGRYSSRRVCLGVLWRAFGRTGHRRMSKFLYCLRAFWFRRGRVGFLDRIGNIGFRRRAAGGKSGCLSNGSSWGDYYCQDYILCPSPWRWRKNCIGKMIWLSSTLFH